MTALRIAVIALLAASLAACLDFGREEVPPLRLAPASLGRTLALQQRLTVTVRGRSQQLEVALEADAEAVRLAMLFMGQAAARLEWDGAQLNETRAPGWPEVVRGDRILGDMQLMYWPAPAIRAALPAGWSLADDGTRRTLSNDGRVVVEVRRLDANTIELTNAADDYRLRVESRASAP